jgi:hypothetical protein
MNEAYASFMWSILLVTLPTQPTAIRLRIWRALRTLGCVSLRDGAFLLPEIHAKSLEPLAEEVQANGGSAFVMSLSPRNAAQKDEVIAQFDRTDAYAQWRALAAVLELDLDRVTEPEARRRLRSVTEALESVRRIDYYPGPAALQAEHELALLRQVLDARFAKGEPQRIVDDDIPRLDRMKFQGKRWATRKRPWVDRLACAWLIRRFIDPAATFVWLSDTTRTPRSVMGFDYDGARFTHIGARVTFEVMTASFGLDTDPQLRRIVAVVRYLDVGGIPVPEVAGLAAVLSGLREIHADDDLLALAAASVFDALYAATGATS